MWIDWNNRNQWGRDTWGLIRCLSHDRASCNIVLMVMHREGHIISLASTLPLGEVYSDSDAKTGPPQIPLPYGGGGSHPGLEHRILTKQLTTTPASPIYTTMSAKYSTILKTNPQK